MTSLFSIILQSSVAVSLLYLIYYIFMRNDTFFSTNRFYLIGALIFSAAVPFLDFAALFPAGEDLYRVFLEPVTITPEGISATLESHTGAYNTLFVIYLAGASIFLARFVFQLIQLGILISKHAVLRHDGVNFVYTGRHFSTFSFFNIIFLNRTDIQSTETRKIIAHEKVHIRQWHSIDLVILELLTIFQWFNPFIWFYRSTLKTLHEYLADEGVLDSGVDANVYSALLFEQSTGIQINDLVNNFSKSLLKRRFIMMTKKRTTKVARLKLLLVLPLALMMLLAVTISPEVMAQEDKKTIPPPPPPKAVQKADKPAEAPKAISQDDPEQLIFTVVEDMPEYPGGKKAMYTYLGQNIKYPAKAMQDSVEGTVFVTFVIKNDGSVSNVRLLRGIGSGCDEEAMRVVEGMPNWKPGKQRGKTVNVQYNLPIKFTLAKDAVKEEVKK